MYISIGWCAFDWLMPPQRSNVHLTRYLQSLDGKIALLISMMWLSSSTQWKTISKMWTRFLLLFLQLKSCWNLRSVHFFKTISSPFSSHQAQRTSNNNMESLREAKPQTVMSKLGSLQAICKFYRHLIENFSKVSFPLNQWWYVRGG